MRSPEVENVVVVAKGQRGDGSGPMAGNVCCVPCTVAETDPGAVL